MTNENAREFLLNYLDHKAFSPVINTFHDNYPARYWNKVHHLQNEVKGIRKGFYRETATAQDVIGRFYQDLDSDAYRQVSSELKSLNLTTFEDVKPGFEELANQLKVE